MEVVVFHAIRLLLEDTKGMKTRMIECIGPWTEPASAVRAKMFRGTPSMGLRLPRFLFLLSLPKCAHPLARPSL